MGVCVIHRAAWPFFIARMGGGHGMAENETPVVEVPAEEPKETDWKAEARKHEQRAKDAYKRVKELEPYEAKVTELEEASKSELQKAQERAEAAEKALAATQGVATRAEVAAAKGVPVALLTGDSREALEASADALLAFRDETARKGNYAPNEGRATNDSATGDLREFTRNLFASND